MKVESRQGEDPAVRALTASSALSFEEQLKRIAERHERKRIREGRRSVSGELRERRKRRPRMGSTHSRCTLNDDADVCGRNAVVHGFHLRLLGGHLENQQTVKVFDGRRW